MRSMSSDDRDYGQRKRAADTGRSMSQRRGRKPDASLSSLEMMPRQLGGTVVRSISYMANRRIVQLLHVQSDNPDPMGVPVFRPRLRLSTQHATPLRQRANIRNMFRRQGRASATPG